MTISQATIRSDTWTAVNDILKSLFPTKNIYAKFPENTKKIKKSDYPLVVMVNPEVKESDRFFGRSVSAKEDLVLVEIYSNNPADIDTYADTIHNYFENNIVVDLHIPQINDSSTDYITINDSNITFKIMSLMFKVK